MLRYSVHTVVPLKSQDDTPDDVQLGGQLFKNAGEVDEHRFKNFDVEIDQDENVPEPIVTGTVTSEYRAVLKHAPRWTTWPDFEQCRWLNDTIKWLWPGLNGAICKQVFHCFTQCNVFRVYPHGWSSGCCYSLVSWLS